jgi:hypothetical protein
MNDIIYHTPDLNLALSARANARENETLGARGPSVYRASGHENS